MTITRRLSSILLGLLTIGFLVPSLPASAAVTYEIHHVATVDGATIRVEIQRDTSFDAEKQPVILTYSPYNNLNGAEPAADGIAARYNPRGFARASADLLGTRGSTGCWDYGGLKEQQSGVDVVQFLAGKKANTDGQFLTWSNGNVGMTGVSYEGTTANMVAATGIPELKGIIPIAAISHWYGYAFYDGVRYFLNSRAPTDEGFDTPLLFDYGLNRTVPEDDPAMLANRVNPTCEQESLTHTQQGYSRTPDYTKFWLDRDYLKDAAKFRAATLVVHGWQDYNVKQDEGLALYEAIPVDNRETQDVVEGVPFKKLVMSQGTHTGAPSQFQSLYDRFWDYSLKGIQNGVDSELPVLSLGRTSSGANGAYNNEVSWPPPTTGNVELFLGRKFDTIPDVPSVGPVGTTGEYGWLAPKPQNTGSGWAHVTTGTISEEITLRDPLNREVHNHEGQPIRGHGYYSLFQESEPLVRDVRITGRAVLDAWVNPLTPSQHLTPLLVEVLPDGTLNLVERGFLNLDYRNGRAQAQPATGWQRAKVTFLPQDYTFKAGNRIGLMLQGSNTVWAVPGSPGVISYAMGPVANVTSLGSRLILPIVGAPADASELFPPAPQEEEETHPSDGGRSRAEDARSGRRGPPR